MNKASTSKITNIASLKKYVDNGEIVELPGWELDVPFVCKLRRSSLRNMITAGKIPNPLMAAAQRLYEGNRSKATASIDQTLSTMRLVVADAMVTPTLDELDEIGISLTEEQFGAIYLYAQNGVRALEQFRQQSGNTDGDNDGQDVENDAEQLVKY